MANGSYDVTITDGVSASQDTRCATFDNAEANAIFNVDETDIVPSSVLQNATTFRVEAQNGDLIFDVVVGANTNLEDAVTEFNDSQAAIDAGYQIEFVQDGGANNLDDSLVLSATDTGTYANGSVLKVTAGGTTATVGTNLSDGANVTLDATFGNDVNFTVDNNRDWHQR